jgi:membrane protein
MNQTYRKFFIKKYVIIPFIIIRSSIYSAIRKDGIEHSGYLAFLSVLSLFPFLIFVVSIAANFGGTDSGLQLVHTILNNIPQNIADSLEPRIAEIVTGPPQSLLTVAVVGIIWTASSMVEGMRTILNRSYRVKSPPAYIWRRLLSIFQFFLIAFSIILTAIFLIVIPAILQKIEVLTGINFYINYDFFHIRSFAIFIILILSVSAIYYLIPNVNQKWDNTFPGSVVCVIYWSAILKLFYIYLEKFNQFNLIYGSLAGIIGALIFFYLISLGLIIGAEFNYNFKRAYRRNFKFIRGLS